MYKNNKYNLDINIQLDNGIYEFNCESATGKTRLAKYFKKLKAYGEPVDSITYNDIRRGIDLKSVFNDGNKVILVDRYDRYKELGHDLMNNLKDKCIILIDCKSPSLAVSSDIESCFIDMQEGSIEVTE